MANVTTIYACTHDGLAIVNKPGTLPEWLPPRRVLAGQPVTSVWADPGPPPVVLAVADSKLLRSESGGRNWERVETGSPATAIYYGFQTSRIFVATEDDLLESADRGITWARVTDFQEEARGSPRDASTGSSLEIPGPPGKPSTLLMGVPSGLSLSNDGGASWQPAELPQPGAVTALARDPERRDRVYAATDTGYLFESGNRGRSWQQINAAPLAPVTYLFVIRI